MKKDRFNNLINRNLMLSYLRNIGIFKTNKLEEMEDNELQTLYMTAISVKEGVKK